MAKKNSTSETPNPETPNPETPNPETRTPTVRVFVPRVTPAGATVYVTEGIKGTLLLSPAFFPDSVLPESIRIEAVWREPKPEKPVDPEKIKAEIERAEKKLAVLLAKIGK